MHTEAQMLNKQTEQFRHQDHSWDRHKVVLIASPIVLIVELYCSNTHIRGSFCN